MRLSCPKCHLSFFTPVASNKVEHLPVPFDITPFSSTPTIAARPHKRDWVPIAICTSPVINFVCPTNILYMHNALSSVSLKTTVTLRRNKKNWRVQTRCITRDVQMWNAVCEKRSLQSWTKLLGTVRT